jgi:hypothetical protein
MPNGKTRIVGDRAESIQGSCVEVADGDQRKVGRLVTSHPIYRHIHARDVARAG